MRWFDACWFLLLCGHLFNKQQNNGVEKVAIFCSFWITELEKWVEVSKFWPVHGPHASWQRRVIQSQINWVHPSEMARPCSLRTRRLDLFETRVNVRCEVFITFRQISVAISDVWIAIASPRASWADAALHVWFCKLIPRVVANSCLEPFHHQMNFWYHSRCRIMIAK